MKKLLSQLKKGWSNVGFYTSHYLSYAFVPGCYYQWKLKILLSSISLKEQEIIKKRVDYYNRLKCHVPISGGTNISNYKFPYMKKHRKSSYFFDFYDVIKYFSEENRFHFIFGDVIFVPDRPSFVKSRPIEGNNENSILLKLDRRRHFSFTENDIPYEKKINKLVFRVTWANESPKRRRFCELFWNHPMCDVGKTQIEENEDMPQVVKPFLSREKQLEYKFIACLEGADVATSLKWVMSSNSIAVSPPMKYETWFMEGTLIPDYHYIEVKEDFSDMMDKLKYYIDHPEKAKEIIKHAHEYIQQFTNERMEEIIQIKVAQKYFELTNK